MIQPPDFGTIHPDTGFSFQLTDEAFNRWWSATVLPEDQAEFVHLYKGGIDEARYVCALDYLTNVLYQDYGADTILMAYFLARNLPIDLKDSHARTDAHYLATADSVRYLTDRARSRSRRVAEERIARRTAAKIEELFERSKDLDGDEKLSVERAALETSIKYLGNQSRERGQEAERRAKKATQAAMERSRSDEHENYKRVPSLAEVRLQLAMLVDAHGADAVLEAVNEVTPRGIESADTPRD